MHEVPASGREQDYRDAVKLLFRLQEMLRAVPLEILFDECGVCPEKFGELMGEHARYLVTEKGLVAEALDSWTPYPEEIQGPGP